MRAIVVAAGAPAVPSAGPAQARSDAHLLDLWLFGKSPHTRRAYLRVAGGFLATLGPGGLRGATLGDLQAWAGTLPGKASSRAVALAAIESLLTFGHRVGYLPVYAGAALPLPKDDLAARILDRAATPRDRALLRLLYVGELRISETVALSWRDLQPRQGSGQSSGKVSVWRLEVSAARRVVYVAAKKAGPPAGPGGASPHWLRHAHATHAMEQGGAGVHLVKATIGHASVATTNTYLQARPDDSSALHPGL